MLLLASCNTTTFEVPKIGTRFENSKKYLDYDTKLNMYVIPIDKYETLQYDRFDIIVPKDEEIKYYAPALSNSSNNAELRVRNLPIQTEFFGRAICSQVVEEWNGLADMEKFFQNKFAPVRGILSRSAHISKFDGCNCVEYDIVARLPDPGKVITVHGFCMFDPKNPGYIIDIGAGRVTYETDVDNDFLIQASGIFFESVRIRK
jgi:hypothetical protein